MPFCPKSLQKCRLLGPICSIAPNHEKITALLQASAQKSGFPRKKLYFCRFPARGKHKSNTKRAPPITGSALSSLLGSVLLSQDPSVQVPSALEGLTVVFGMGTSGTPPPVPPNMIFALLLLPRLRFSKRSHLIKGLQLKIFKV